jgi:signal peptidase II
LVTHAEVSRQARPRSRAFARAVVLAAVVIGLDQLTKHTIATSVADGESRSVLPGVSLVHVRNHGVAFGVLSGGGPLVLAFTLAALTALVVFLALRPARRGLWVATGLLLGGALGNLIDRLAGGAVTDFVKLPLWPAFNLADVSITAGVFALLWVLEAPRGERARR